MKRDRELEMFFRTVLHRDTLFTIKKVYQYDTYPGYALLAGEDRLNGEFFFDNDEDKKFSTVFKRFREMLEYKLEKANLMENKIAVELEFQIPSFRQGCIGQLLWCHKDMRNGFFLGCNHNGYVKETNIEFHI